MKRSISKLELAIVAILALVLIALAAWNAWVPQYLDAPVNQNVNPWALSDFRLGLWGKYLCYAILAISVDILWGYTGLLSLGQALFFSLGGYMLGMHLMLMIGKLGQYKSDLPDFLVFLGHTFLPRFWKPFSSFPFAAAMVIIVPASLALIFGYLAFRSRIKGVYFSILTQALTYGAALMFFRNDMLMGGNNGFTDFKQLLGYDIRSAVTQRTLFLITGFLVVAIYLGCRWLNGTKFGLVQEAIRDGENRVLFSGYPVARFKLFAFTLSAIIASLGGALYVTQARIINPAEMSPEKSLEAVVWCAVGGRGTLLGPILGAIGVNALKSWATTEFPDYWLMLLGGLFILVVLFLPKGMVGVPAQIRALLAAIRARGERPSSSPGAPASASPVSSAIRSAHSIAP